MAESNDFTPTFLETLVVMAAVSTAGVDTDTSSDTFGHFIVKYQSGETVDYGIVTAYGAAKAAGYAGTETQFIKDMQNVVAYSTGKKYNASGNLDRKSVV